MTINEKAVKSVLEGLDRIIRHGWRTAGPDNHEIVVRAAEIIRASAAALSEQAVEAAARKLREFLLTQKFAYLTQEQASAALTAVLPFLTPASGGENAIALQTKDPRKFEADRLYHEAGRPASEHGGMGEAAKAANELDSLYAQCAIKDRCQNVPAEFDDAAWHRFDAAARRAWPKITAAVRALAPPPQSAAGPLKKPLEISREWCIAAAKREGDSEVGAGPSQYDLTAPPLMGVNATAAISPSDPLVTIAGIRQFGLASDGSDLRDLEAAFAQLALPQGGAVTQQGREDVARILFAFDYPTADFDGEGATGLRSQYYERAAVLALPHTGQPQEGWQVSAAQEIDKKFLAPTESGAPRSKPLYGTDFSQPLSKAIEAVRSQIAQSRGQLDDIGMAFPGYKQDMDMVHGLLTCGLVTLHWIMEEMQKREQAETKLLVEQETRDTRIKSP